MMSAGPLISSPQPLIWVMEGVHAGDNAQVRILARALSSRRVSKKLSFNHLYSLPNLLLGASLRSLEPDVQAALTPPWPDLVIAVGRRSVPVVRWIRRQSHGKTRLVHLGRPRAPLRWFDLVVTTPQYGLPKRSNVLHNLLPVTEDVGQIDEPYLSFWKEQLVRLPRPWIMLSVGGSRWPFRLDATESQALARAASTRAAELGGSLLVTTSPRTGEAASHALQASIRGPALIHLWQQGAGNPYLAFLQFADRFIVTGDSVSMMTEACRRGRPTEIYQLPKELDQKWNFDHLPYERLKSFLTAEGFFTPPRKVDQFVATLVAGRHAILLGEDDPVAFAPLPDPLPGITSRIAAILPVQTS